MKFKLVLFTIVLLTFSNVEAQSSNQIKGFNTPTYPINPSPTIHNEIPVIFGVSGDRIPAADRYILDIKTLRTCFKKGKIPRDFPEYENDLSLNDNKNIALKWAKKHKRLLTKENRLWLTQKSKA
ncbi:MAG: hypothetical protein RL365_437 [Bacteroidota bacterium]|jgi:hypothetical protein